MSLSVLIVEDEPLVAMALEALVADNGWRPLGPACSVAEALELVERACPDCVLLDLNLRGESSLPVAEALADKGVTFAFTSGYDGAGIAARFPDRPSFPKPVDERRLQRFLADLSRSRVAPGAAG